MKKHIEKLKSYFLAHKIISVIVLVAVLGGGYWGYNKLTSTAGDIRYITAKVEKGTIISSISGSGQVSASNQLDVKPKVGGEITAVYVKAGQEVNAGAILAAVDSADAQRTVRDAETALETAKLELDKILEPLDELTLLQAETSLAETKESKQKAKDNIKKAYDDGFNTVSGAFLDLPSIVTGLENLLAQNNLSDNAARMSGNTAQDYRNTAETAYYAAQNAFNINRKYYRTLDHNSPTEDIDKIINQTYETTKLIADATKKLRNFVDYLAEDTGRTSEFTSYQNTLSTYTNTTNGHLSSLLSLERSLKDSQEAIVSADRTITEKELSLTKTKEGPDNLDIRAKKIAIQQREDALATAKQALADHYIRAPFGGVVAKVTAKKGDSASAGTAIAILITKQKIAEISLNEVDVAKIKVAQKTTLIFDAIPDFSMTGVVAEVDSIGTVSQGVVTYIVKISFDTQDERVKPAMSVSAAIITDIKQDVLVVANSAIKSQAGISYVENFDTPLVPPIAGAIGSIAKIAPNKIPIEVGLSNDTQSEIISGIEEGDEIVTRTILPTTATTTATAPSIFGTPATGNRGTGGGGFGR